MLFNGSRFVTPVHVTEVLNDHYKAHKPGSIE